ncbi:MAG: AraC family transcriptional regulator [Cyclobacteriaceae bacterium]
MKPKQLTRKSMAHESFSVSRQLLPRFLNMWHFHEEIEIVYIVRSEGTKFIGDSITKFLEGDLVMIGSCLPHLWLNSQQYFESNEGKAESISIHFHPHCFGKAFFDIPEMARLNRLLQESQLGLEIKGPMKEKIVQKMENLVNQKESYRFLSLIDLLLMIAEAPDKTPLSSLSFMESYQRNSSSRLDKIYEFILNHFKEDINLEMVAEVVSMNPSAFSRYFKQATNKTFVQYLNEVRIGYACKKLIYDTDKNVSEIGYESGFNNISNFNKQFKKITKQTPSQYLLAHSNGHMLLQPQI